ncbi:MAG: LSU ribosomal protein L33p @ LSU ribosomal protein L33p, zinc-independent, partial [uncultured Sphingomonas sp.]
GEASHRQDQARQQRRHRILLRDEKEPAHPDGEAKLQEVRSGGAQARRLQGSEDQV